MVPRLVEHGLLEGLELAKREESNLRSQIATLEGQLVEARASLIEYEAARQFIEEFNATSA